MFGLVLGVRGKRVVAHSLVTAEYWFTPWSLLRSNTDDQGMSGRLHTPSTCRQQDMLDGCSGQASGSNF